MFEFVNCLVAGLAAFALLAVGCRSDQLEWSKHQGRFIVGNILVACYALATLLHVLGQANVSWYSIFGVSAACVLLINQAGEWEHGVPARMWRTAPLMRLPGFELRWRRLVGSVQLPYVVLQRYAVPHGLVDAIAVLTLVGPLVMASLLYQKGHGEPIDLYAGRPEAAAVEVGQPLTVVWDLRRRRDCPGEIRQFIFDADGAHILSLPPRIAGKVKPGPRGPFIARIELPGLPPGDYTYRANVRSQCEDADYSIWSPDIHFSVVELKGSAK